MKRINEKWNYTLHEYYHYYVHGILYSRLKFKSVSIDSRLATFPHKNKTSSKIKQNHVKFAYDQVLLIIEKQPRAQKKMFHE